MTDILDMAAQRTPLRITGDGPPASAKAGAPASIPEQPPLTPGPVPSRAPRKWVRTALASLLAVLLLGGAYWYVTGVHVADDPNVNVGESGISTDVSGVVRNIDVAGSSSCCERSPRSRLSPRAIAGRPESRRGDLHLAALPLPFEACPPISTRFGGFSSWTSHATC
jgi:hypothetical protein